MLLTILTFIIVLSILVFVHELGHFWVAKRLGIRVEEFGFGLPPRAWGKKIGETIYSINWLPIGGFVRLSGEDMEEEEKQISDPAIRHRFFWARSKKERAAVLLAGVTMNFVLAVVIISFIFTRGVFVPTDRVHISSIAADSPAAAVGIQANDIVVSLAGESIKTTQELINATQDNLGKPTEIVVERGGERLTFVTTPRPDPPEGEGPLGIVISNLEERRYPWHQAPFFGLIEALKMSYLMVSTLTSMLWKLMTFQPVQVDVSGPIGIAQATGQAVRSGIMSVLQLTGILSLNLAIINLLPIPALDGGRLLFVVLEKFIGRKVKPKLERAAHQIGMVFLLALIALVTINDILRIFRG